MSRKNSSLGICRPLVAATALAAGMLAVNSVHAERIENGVAIFSALDKVTARTSKFEVPLNATAQFGAQGHAARLIRARRLSSRRRPRSSRSTRSNSMGTRSASSPAGCSPRAPG
jgi:hypothetical protein